MKKSVFKSDKFKKVRGGYSRLLEIACAKCGHVVCQYQKDGPGMLKRMYLDRIYNSDHYSNLQNMAVKDVPKLVCLKCKEVLGVPMIYKKEKRSDMYSDRFYN